MRANLCVWYVGPKRSRVLTSKRAAQAGPRGPWQRPSPGVGYFSPVRASALAISGPLPATPASVPLLGPVAPPPLWQERAAQPADAVFQPVAPPGSESARSFVYGARLFRRLLRFWGSLRWPAPGASAVQEAVTWVELTLFFELAVGAELPYCVEGKTGSRPEHFRYAEDGAAYSPATVEQKAAVLAKATWALEALVGEVLPSAARREPGVGCCRSYYTVGGLGAFGLSRQAGVRLPGLRQRPRLPHAPEVYGILREFLGAVALPSDAASARALWTRPSPVAERVGLANVVAGAPGGEGRIVE